MKAAQWKLAPLWLYSSSVLLDYLLDATSFQRGPRLTVQAKSTATIVRSSCCCPVSPRQSASFCSRASQKALGGCDAFSATKSCNRSDPNSSPAGQVASKRPSV